MENPYKKRPLMPYGYGCMAAGGIAWAATSNWVWMIVGVVGFIVLAATEGVLQSKWEEDHKCD